MASSTPSLIRTGAKVLLGSALVFAGVSHLTRAREEFQAQVPEWVPLDKDTVVLASGVAYGTPLLYAALGELLAERTGVLNLGVEGMMLVGAVMGFWAVQRLHAGTGLSLAAAIGVAALGLAACTNPDGTRDNRATGATVGALGGAAVGNLLGGDSRSTLIGAGGGAAVGALIGNQQDQQQQGY